MISNTLFTIVMSSLGTLLVVSVARDLNHYKKKSSYRPEHSYKIGDRVIVNAPNGTPILCEIIELERFVKSKECCYKVVAHYEDNDIRVQSIGEYRIQCTDLQFGLGNLNAIKRRK